MALGDDARCKPTQHSKPFVAQTTFQRIVGQKNIHLKRMSDKEFNCNFKELIPENLEYLTIVNGLNPRLSSIINSNSGSITALFFCNRSLFSSSWTVHSCNVFKVFTLLQRSLKLP